MTLALWVIALCQLTERVLSIRALRSKGFLRPIKAMRDRKLGREKRPLRVTEIP